MMKCCENCKYGLYDNTTGTKSALEKLTDRQRETLETNKTHLANMRANGNHDASIETRLYIRGYLDALRESGIITETESRCLWTYATL